MKDRTKKYNYRDTVEWTAEEVVPLIANGKCAVTGFPFRLGTSGKGTAIKNPFQASPDRIDNERGYTKKNTRFVVFIYNTMRNNFTDEDVNEFVEHIQKVASPITS